jgi:ferrous iron transport protein B
MTTEQPTTTLRRVRVALVGSPNAGKTTTFNALSGLRAKTANYPGVTVTRREAEVVLGDTEVTLIDLPGTYGLEPLSPDEQVVVDALQGRVEGVEQPDALVMVADATSLERSMFLVAEVLRLGLPACLVLTMIDEVAARGGAIDLERLSKALGIPVVGVVGHRGIGMDALRALLVDPAGWSRPVLSPPVDSADVASWSASILGRVVAPLEPDQRSRRVDALLLHPVWGVVVFVVVMLTFFQVIFTLAAPIMDELASFFQWLSTTVSDAVPGLLGQFLADGVIAGVGGVLAFLPQIVLLFVMIALLEKVGYLSRAAFLADRVMGRFGLEGRSFVAMLSSFACAVPGIMSTRTIANERRRLSTMMAAPLMTCSARLPVYTLLIAAFVPNEVVVGPLRLQGLVLFGLYVLGAVSGLLYAAVLSSRTSSDHAVPMLLELPPYRRPTAKSVLLSTWEAAWSFLRKAGTIILATSMVLWVLFTFPRVAPPPGMTEAQATSYQLERSAAGHLGRALDPVFDPLGFNWQINVAIVGSLAAREVFVSTLAQTTAAGSEQSLPKRLETMQNPDGSLVFSAATVAAILLFFVYALQCFSTMAVLRRETMSWRWPLIAFGTMFALAYVAALLAHTVAEAFG